MENKFLKKIKFNSENSKLNYKELFEKHQNNCSDYFYKKTKVNVLIEKKPNQTINQPINKLISEKLSGNKQITKPLIKNLENNIFNEKDIDIDNKIRGDFSRLSKPEFQLKREKNDEMRLQYLNKNFQDPNKLILPFPRGGEITREKYSKNAHEIKY